MMDPSFLKFAGFLATLLGVPLAAYVAFGVSRAYLRRLEGASSLSPEQEALLEEAAASVGEVHRLRQELAEVQERVDFAERMLARRQDTPPAALPGRG